MTRLTLRTATASCAVTFGILAVALGGPALAQSAAPAADAAPAKWTDTLKIGVYGQAGILANPDTPPERKNNFGHLVTDRANQVQLNQLGFSAERPIDPTSEEIDLGFRIHAFYGSDARYFRYLGLGDRDINDAKQFSLIDAFGTVHLPYVAPGGIDLKIGLFSTPLGGEVIDPRVNYFYSHSYVFNFGLPFQHMGVLSTTHLPYGIDLYLGGTAGSNTTVFSGGDNNDVPGWIAGLGTSLYDGELAILALTHFGPENATRAIGNRANRDNRYFNDILVTWKPNDKLTLISEFNYIRDDGAFGDGEGAQAYGIVQTGVYALTDTLSIAGRGEIFRDNEGFFVANFLGNFDFVNVQRGEATTFPVRSGGRTTYGAFTIALNYKPDFLPAQFEGLVVRPELRYDRSLNDTRPFDGGRSEDQFTFGLDVVIPFSIF